MSQVSLSSVQLNAVQRELASVKKELIKLQKSRPASPEHSAMQHVEQELSEVKQELVKLQALSRPASPKSRVRSKVHSPLPTNQPSVPELNDKSMILVKERAC